MNMKKITAIAAAVVIAAGICSGVPTGTGNSPLMAITAEAAIKQIGDLKATVTHSGVSIDITWSEVKNVDSYNIMVLYSTTAIPFNITDNAKIFALKSVPAGGETYISIPTIGLPLDISGKPYHYNVQILPLNKQGEPVDNTTNLTYYFDSLDDLDQTDFSAAIAAQNTPTADSSKTSVTAESDTLDELPVQKVSAPKNFKASKTKNTITLKWDEVEGADMYRVYKYNPETKKYEKYKNVKNPKCKITDLEAGTKYKFKVVSYDKNEDGKYVKGETSKAVSVTTKK